MSKVNQKEAVFNTVTSFLNEQGKSVIDGEAVMLEREDKRTIIGMLATSLEANEIEVSEAKQAKMTEDKHYRDYASNILNNWSRKDTRLNGGEKYQTKNPGSRAGAGDDQVRELKKFRSTLSDADQIASVDKAIEERLTVLKAERNAAKVTEINFDLIPEFAHLKGNI
jgi:hypothetical protein